MEATNFNFTLLRELADRISAGRAAQRTTRESTHSEFNVFRALGLVGYELPTSRFLSYLLNPKGDHDCDGTFLHAFLETLCEDEPQPAGNREEASRRLERVKDLLDNHSCKVHREYRTKGGRSIDIVLEFPDFRIGIENKIEAGDQPNQVHDYSDFLGASGLILYLTKFGSESETAGDKPYVQLSYQNHIRAWLDRCLKKMGDAPRVFENLRQFRDSIDEFLNPNCDAVMTNFSEFIIKEPEILRHQFDIVRAMEEAKRHAMALFFDKLSSSLRIHGIQLECRLPAAPNTYLNYAVVSNVVQTIRSYPLTIEQEGHNLGTESEFPLVLGFRPSVSGFTDSGHENSLLQSLRTHLEKQNPKLIDGSHSNWPAGWIQLNQGPFTPENCATFLGDEEKLCEVCRIIAEKVFKYVCVVEDWLRKNPTVNQVES